MASSLVISIDELWLKGRNQKHYFKAAIDHINAVIKNNHSDKYTQKVQSQRLYYTSETAFSDEVIKALTFVPGLAYISPCTIIDRAPGVEIENIYQEILKELSFLENSNKTFRATVKRNDKNYPLSSVELQREIGHRIIEKYPHSKVELVNPELTVEMRIFADYATISTKAFRGIGGLPWGSTGHAVSLLSGGFDSPVASYLMTKRGIRQDYVFFHAYPFVGREVLTKIKGLASSLAKFQRQAHLYIVPFGDIQNLISKNCKEEYRTLFFRRYMIEIANLLAERIGASALVTGDCVGQVSSQTLANLHLMDKASERIILRPLIGYNKMEIMHLAATIGTHDISIIPHDDACSLFASKNPIITPNQQYWDLQSTEFNMATELNKALDNIESYSVNILGELYKKDYFSFDG